jgi:2-polyprenyl-3-methyl-5-hydroxy-6-metoxy-1,4-benzoquinol methylase
MDAQYALNYRELYENHWWWRARENLILATIVRLKPEGNWGSILDVGCGGGLFFDRLSQFGEVEGVEPNSSLVESDNPWKDRIHVSNFDATFQPGKQYSLILLLDVLEHLSNPNSCLRRSEELLDSTGILLMTVPAFTSLWTTHDDLNRHFARYTKQSFLELISLTSLRIQDLRFFFHWTFPVKFFIHCKEKYFQTDPVIPKVPSPSVNALLFRLSIFEQKIFSATPLPFGSSLLAVCTKQ